MFDFLKEMISGPKGEISSKRVLGTICVIAGIVFAFISVLGGKPDAATCGIIFGTGATFLTAAAISHT
ncbi:MAG: hypothetical protein HGB12_00260 [Bacteroidetes bacterium]|nr:hypothetical protein [Bacteroidota bacterium]